MAGKYLRPIIRIIGDTGAASLIPLAKKKIAKWLADINARRMADVRGVTSLESRGIETIITYQGSGRWLVELHVSAVIFFMWRRNGLSQTTFPVDAKGNVLDPISGLATCAISSGGGGWVLFEQRQLSDDPISRNANAWIVNPRAAQLGFIEPIGGDLNSVIPYAKLGDRWLLHRRRSDYLADESVILDGYGTVLANDPVAENYYRSHLEISSYQYETEFPVEGDGIFLNFPAFNMAVNISVGGRDGRGIHIPTVGVFGFDISSVSKFSDGAVNVVSRHLGGGDDISTSTRDKKTQLQYLGCSFLRASGAGEAKAVWYLFEYAHDVSILSPTERRGSWTRRLGYLEASDLLAMPVWLVDQTGTADVFGGVPQPYQAFAMGGVGGEANAFAMDNQGGYVCSIRLDYDYIAGSITHTAVFLSICRGDGVVINASEDLDNASISSLDSFFGLSFERMAFFCHNRRLINKDGVEVWNRRGDSYNSPLTLLTVGEKKALVSDGRDMFFITDSGELQLIEANSSMASEPKSHFSSDGDRFYYCSPSISTGSCVVVIKDIESNEEVTASVEGGTGAGWETVGLLRGHPVLGQSFVRRVVAAGHFPS